MPIPLPFSTPHPLIGAVHLLPLPGSPRWAEAQTSISALIERAVRDATTYLDAGFDGLIVENFGDAPFYKVVPPETVAVVTRAVREVILRAGSTPVGVNVLRNDAHAALACAVAAGAQFVRVNVHTGTSLTDQGIVEGTAAETMRLRAALGAGPGGPHPVAVLTDVHVKHARPLGDETIGFAAQDTAERGLADGLIVSGHATGDAPDLLPLREVRLAVPDRPLWIGSGLTVKGCATLAKLVDGAIVGSAAEAGGRAGAPVELARARALVEAWRAATAE